MGIVAVFSANSRSIIIVTRVWLMFLLISCGG